MKILSIAGILPIPGLITSNDFVFHTYINYKKLYPQDDITIVRPTQYKTNLKKIIRRETEFNKLNGKRVWDFYGFKVHIFPFFSSRKVRDLHALLSYSIYLFNRKKIQRIITEQQIEIVHAQYIYPDGLLAYIINKKYKIPYVITSHNELFYFKYPFSCWLGKKIIGKAHKVLPINFRNVNFFQQQGFNNIEILPLGFYDKFIKPVKTNINPNVKIISVCELIALKNVDKVLLALSKLADKYNFEYTIVGRGPEKEKLQKLTTTLNLNKFVSFVEHVPHEQIAEVIYEHDIFIMPSYVETFGRVYFEAMAMGLPILCARNSGIHGYYKEMEEGVTVIHNNINDISEKLEILISNPNLRLKIGRQGQQLVKHYTWENIAKRLQEIYEEATIK